MCFQFQCFYILRQLLCDVVTVNYVNTEYLLIVTLFIYLYFMHLKLFIYTQTGDHILSIKVEQNNK